MEVTQNILDFAQHIGSESKRQIKDFDAWEQYIKPLFLQEFGKEYRHEYASMYSTEAKIFLKLHKDIFKLKDTQNPPLTARRMLDKWLCGSMLDLQSNCNSKYRELALAKKRNDLSSVKFWSKRINLLTEVQNLLFIWFYEKENTITNENEFKKFIETFKRYTQITTGVSWYEIATGGKN